MGHKGVAKRKPKLKSPSPKGAMRPGASPSIASLVHDKGAPTQRGGMNPAGGSSKKSKNAR
jgi:hypothetical protein